MFTEGLDPHSLRWVRQQNTSRGLGIPPPEKFSGRGSQFPRGVVPPSRTMRVEEYSGSDMDESSDTEEEILRGRYSIDTSPQDDILRRKAPVKNIYHYSSDGYSGNSEFSSSRETIRLQQQKQLRKNVVVGSNGYCEEEESDSGGSSEYVGNGVRGVSSNGNVYRVDGYRKVPVREDVKVVAKENEHSDVPSAPPFHIHQEEISQASDQMSGESGPTLKTYVGSNGYSRKKVPLSQQSTESRAPIPNNSAPVQAEAAASSGSLPARLPTFHASGQGPWYSVLAYEACVRLCLHSWARGCIEAPSFLENECALLRNSFGLQHIVLQSEEELLAKRSCGLGNEGTAFKPKKIIGKMKVQARKVRMSPDMPSGCHYLSLTTPAVKLESFKYRMSSLHSTLSTGWESLRKVRVLPRLPANSSFSRHSLAYMQASTQYIKQVSGLLKIGVTTLRSSSYEAVQETYSCVLRLKSVSEEDAVRLQAGSGETHVFFPDSLSDDLLVEVYDSKGKSLGRVNAQLANIAENPSDKVRWWSIYHEPEHELVGRIQLYVNYTTSVDENSGLKCGSIAETVAYDLVLEVAMKVQHFQQRQLLLHGSWKWLLTEFASYYGVSEVYTKLRYLSYIMDVATPTADCLMLVHDLLLPVILKSRSKTPLSHQENRILGEIEEQLELILAMVFENYKSLDESSPTGVIEVFRSGSGTPAPALLPAVKLYTLLHDVLAPEVQLKLCGYFQAAAKTRSRQYLLETDEFVATNSEGTLLDSVTVSTAYQKMKNLCLNIRKEIFTDIQIHDQHILPSFVDLPNICASIYSVDLCNRLRAFLVACPPTGPSPHVTDVVIATADFQKDLARWNISPIKGGVDAKELFHLYIVIWIQDKRLALLEACKLDKVKWSGVRTRHNTTPFVDEMFDRINETLNEYEVIICRWPEYTFVLENAIADVEKAIIEALERQYADVLSPLKDSMAPKKFGLKYVQKLAKRNSLCPYNVPEELGILLNTMKRLLDVLRPKVEAQFKAWSQYMPDGGNNVAGEHLNEFTVTLRAKFRNYLQAVVEKLAENTRVQSTTKLKKIIQEAKDVVLESDIAARMQPLKDHLVQAINQLHTIFEGQVFVALCRGFWDRMGQDVLNFLENRKENRAWYKGSRVALSVLNKTFASQMQQLLGNSLQERDVEPPNSIKEARSVLCKDTTSHKDPNFYY